MEQSEPMIVASRMAICLLLASSGCGASAQETGLGRMLREGVSDDVDVSKALGPPVNAITQANCAVNGTAAMIFSDASKKVTSELEDARRKYSEASKSLTEFAKSRSGQSPLRHPLDSKLSEIGLPGAKDKASVAERMATVADDAAKAIEDLLAEQKVGPNLHRVTKDAADLTTMALLLAGVPSS